MTVNELQKQLTGLDTFQRKSDDQLRNLAESMYKPQYQQDVQSLKDSLNQQLAVQGRNALSNGMQRSSYNQAAQASIQAGGLRSQADLAASYEGNVAAMLAQLLQNEDSREDTYNSNKNSLLLNLYKATKSSGSGSDTTGTIPKATGDTAGTGSKGDTQLVQALKTSTTPKSTIGSGANDVHSVSNLQTRLKETGGDIYNSKIRRVAMA